jgi:hypothetical protein
MLSILNRIEKLMPLVRVLYADGCCIKTVDIKRQIFRRLAKERGNALTEIFYRKL